MPSVSPQNPNNQATLSVFDFQNNPVRVEVLNGEPLFCLTDVAKALDITNANPKRFNMKKDGVHKMYSIDSMGRDKDITFINEPNLYRLIFRSNKKEAVKFQDWVFEEVLPQIRQTGHYHNYSLIDEYNKAVLLLEKMEDMASNAGRALSIVGKQLKPKAKDRVTALQGQIQLILPITLIGE